MRGLANGLRGGHTGQGNSTNKAGTRAQSTGPTGAGNRMQLEQSRSGEGALGQEARARKKLDHKRLSGSLLSCRGHGLAHNIARFLSARAMSEYINYNSNWIMKIECRILKPPKCKGL